ncbi:MAG: apolipoprotein N-acyltransferase [Actinobacteria bacterium]|nr:apolipoprotein N-acyltransferase [Actinomycetota bacterium]MCL5447155.1 apolipoprotein N-acyltransferase [Actinomycetota bacterium]
MIAAGRDVATAPDLQDSTVAPSDTRHAKLEPRRPSKRRYRVLAALVGGALAALSLPPWGWWILAFPATAIAYLALDGLRWKARFAVGWAFGLGMLVPGLWWSFTFNVYGGCVLMVAEALFLAVAATAVPSRGARMLALPAVMVLAEYFRERWPFGGLPVGGIELGQAASPLGTTSRIGGPLLIVWLVWLSGSGLAILCISLWPRLQHRFESAEPAGSTRSTIILASFLRRVARCPGALRERTCRLAAAGSAALAVVVIVSVLAAVAPDGGPPTGHLRVASVQGGGRRGTIALQVNPLTVFYAAVDATEEIPHLDKGKPPQLIVWPEDTVALDGHLRGSEHELILQNLARSLHATLEAGVTEPVGSTRFENFSVAFSPTGKIVSRYEKIHRVPFGEYVPYRSFFKHLANLKDIPRNAIPGHGPAILDTPAGKFGIMISFETFFARRGRAATREGGRLLLVPTNTNSYAASQMPSQEIAASRLRAIEEGRDLVQSAPTGYSALINNQGQVMQLSTLAKRQVLIGDVALRNGATLYERFGDLPILIIAILSLLIAWGLEVDRRLRKKRRKILK